MLRRLRRWEEQIAGLQRRISLLPAQQTPLTPDAFDELLQPFEILRAVAEELRSQGSALQAQESFLRAQTAVAEVALSTLQPAILAPRLLAAIARAQGYSFGFLWRASDDGEDASLIASFGDGLAPFLGERRPLNRPGFLAGQTIRSGQPTFRNHLLEAQDDNPQTKRMVDAQALENGDLFSQVDRLKEAFETHLFHSYRVDPNLIALKIDLAEVFLSVDTAIPVG